jgi:hypothetical protein
MNPECLDSDGSGPSIAAILLREEPDEDEEEEDDRKEEDDDGDEGVAPTGIPEEPTFRLIFPRNISFFYCYGALLGRIESSGLRPSGWGSETSMNNDDL